MLDEGEMQYTKPEQEKGEKTPTTHLPKALSLKKKKKRRRSKKRRWKRVEKKKRKKEPIAAESVCGKKKKGKETIKFPR